MLEISELYKVTGSKKVQEMEKELSIDLEDLKKDIEDNIVDHIPVKMISSIPMPKDVSYFRRERKLVIDRLLQVSEAQPLKMQAEIIKEEMMSAEENEYSAKSLPLLLHQYYIEKIYQLVQCKHLHMLRWKRFCEHTSTIESLYPHYTKRLNHIMAEYHDSVQRAHRLSLAREDLLCGTEQVVNEVKIEDILIYLRWMVCHFHSMKRVNQYLRVLKWLPLTHRAETSPPEKEKEDLEEGTTASKIASRYGDDSLSGLFQRPKSGVSRPSSAVSVQATGPIPTAPPINPSLLTTNPLPSSVFTMAAAATSGGIATDESTQGLPLNAVDFETLKPHLSFLLNIYGINYDLNSIHNSADEMEMYAAVNRKFQSLFNRQEVMKTFKTYDRLEPGQQGWGSDSPSHCLKQESNWISFVTLKSESDPQQEIEWTNLRHRNNVDEILRYMEAFTSVSDPQKVQETLRDHATMVQNPPEPQEASVTTHRSHKTYDTRQTWRKIYSNPDLYADNDLDDNLQDDEEMGGTGSKSARAVSARRRKDSYDYKSTVQMLGLDEGEQENQDPASLQGAFLAFLHLRHLRTRDLQRTALSVFNYFRSIERTLTINDAGLSQEVGGYKKTSQQNHRRATEHDGTVGGGGGIGYHGYMHNTPADFKLSESEFMEFSDIENHDDFYTMEEGRVHVQDQRGYYVVYDAAENDLKNMEKEILLIATHYIEKDRDLRKKSKVPKSARESARKKLHSAPGDFDIGEYSHQEIDRFGVLMDLWNNLTSFMECKRELLDCYVEAYQHVFDKDEKRAMAQVMMNLIYKKPRFDFKADYFIKTIRAECVILRHMTTLIKNIMDKQIEEQREYLQKVCREGEEFGLPLSVVPKQPISINLSRPALRNIYMLEFHPSLSIASRVPVALKYALQELIHIHQPKSVYSMVMIEKRLLEVACKEWDRSDKLDTYFTQQVQKDLFAEVYVEDPIFMCMMARTMVDKKEEEGTRKNLRDRQLSMMGAINRLLETLTCRHRLMDAALETGILAGIYKKQAVEMGFSDYHMYIRAIQFESASMKDDAGKPPPISMSDVQEDDSAVYKMNVPLQQPLAINELDEAQIGRFSFRTREAMEDILQGSGLENLKVILQVQIVQKNAITSAVLQASACVPIEEPDLHKSSGRASPSETKSEKSSVTQMTSFSGGTGASTLGAKLSHDQSLRFARSPDAFVSIQLEKTPSRDLMLNDFVKKRNEMRHVLMNPEESKKAKRHLIKEFCYRFNQRMTQYSLRGQLIAYYNSILRLLKDFPNIRKTYFMVGDPYEKKQGTNKIEGLTPDPKQDKKRPRQLLTNDGQHVLNLWFIPHHTEALVMFKNLSDDKIVRALSFSLSIVASIHDMLQYLCAHSRLGSSHARLGSQRMEFVSADWGGTEGIGAELREIQKQIENLPHPTDPRTIADFLAMRRDVMFLEFDTAVRHCMMDTFLSTGNVQSFNSLKNNIYHALPNLSNVQRPTLQAMCLTVPEPLEPRDFQARELFPWRSFLGRNGPYPLMYYQWHMIEHYIQLCLSGLKDVDRHVANGEILGVSLLMEDVLQTGYQDISHLSDADDLETARSEKKEGSVTTSRGASRLDIQTPTGSISSKAETPKSLSRTKEPVEAYKLLKFFLILWKCLEHAKYAWGKRKLFVEEINKPSLFKEYCKVYKTEVLLPVLQSVARRLGQGELYEGIAMETDPLVMPKGASEIEIRSKQLVKLLETFECHMITEIRKKIDKEATLATAERVRVESNLATDLWKRPVMKESFTLAKPLIAEDFVTKLKKKMNETESGDFTIGHDDLNECVSELARNIMTRERHNFDSYTMYYENLLRVHHTLLYSKEQEVKHLQDALKAIQHDTMVDVQCLLGTHVHDLLQEVTALRAKIHEMRESSMSMEQDCRERVKEEYRDLIKNLLEASSVVKNKLDEFRNELFDDVCEKIEETRREALREMDEAKERKDDDDLLQRYLAKSEKLREHESTNYNLSLVVNKMKVVQKWRQQSLLTKVQQSVANLRKQAEMSQKEKTQADMLYEQERISLYQQLDQIKDALKVAEKECHDIRQKLEKELKEKQEKTHEAQQRARSQKQLEMAKQANIEKLEVELKDRDTRLRILSDEQDKVIRMQHMQQDKIRKDIETVRKQLSHERSLKLDAFTRVDDLQTQVYDLESCYISRAQSSMAMSPAPSKARSRIQSAQRTRSHNTPTSNWPPPVMWPANRSLTPGAPGGPPVSEELNYLDERKIQRPKTVSGKLRHSITEQVGGRLRSRIAEQLLNELELDSHRTVIQLEELQLENRPGSGRRETAY
ncbi:uncharacterized protein LOC133187394 [Saccostrea echinata]|uniref:uncharacterized protein LOC133187394 n=1 Tax=Saccostrea echinata TaxID=191078 RepID=UPI002A81B1BF|nr:uncharacterized protein LOC133187394 [Saccostrea echinata]